ncbi:MAG TPA: DUF1003 domain-containing protein [Spirochaetota bacterium]|nr:DUF1003 domain-containing protein [Spirochaetota bacterium]HPI90445.1 DUF1003 domain-containing protein [Spirochaetota bacterium]HPR49354.1 DUF1003 domain-containing protein [Spirochaetota bacterium]
MKRKQSTTGCCQITNIEHDRSELVPLGSIRKPIVELIRHDHPEIRNDGLISLDELNRYRQKYLNYLLVKEKGELSELDTEVLKTIHDSELLSKNIEDASDEKLTLGQKLADMIARFGGSWIFICLFFFLLVLWMFTNAVILIKHPFDPYPFILLNLVLSCLAAIQAPIIMMSQNRQESKDRMRSLHDYQINLKSELEIRQLNEKIDHLIIHQMQRLMDIQQIQLDYLDEISSIIEKLKDRS